MLKRWKLPLKLGVWNTFCQIWEITENTVLNWWNWCFLMIHFAKKPYFQVNINIFFSISVWEKHEIKDKLESQFSHYKKNSSFSNLSPVGRAKQSRNTNNRTDYFAFATKFQIAEVGGRKFRILGTRNAVLGFEPNNPFVNFPISSHRFQHLITWSSFLANSYLIDQSCIVHDSRVSPSVTINQQTVEELQQQTFVRTKEAESGIASEIRSTIPASRDRSTTALFVTRCKSRCFLAGGGARPTAKEFRLYRDRLCEVELRLIESSLVSTHHPLSLLFLQVLYAPVKVRLSRYWWLFV